MPEEIMETFRWAVDQLNKHELDYIDKLYSPDIVYHGPPFPDITGRDVYKRFMNNMVTSFPDLHLAVDQIITEGDRTIMTGVLSGTNTGQSRAFPFAPTGKKASWATCTISRVVEGRVVEVWAYTDNLNLLQQLGVLPSME